MKHLLFLLFLLGSALSAVAQFGLTGKVQDQTNHSPIVGANVQLISIKDSTDFLFSVTDGQGAFAIKEAERGFYRLKVTSLAYVTYARVMRVVGDVDLGTIAIEPDTRMLDVIEIKGDVVPMETRGDTVLYNADAFKVNEDASAADLVSKMPGISVSDDGVESNGESVEQVLLDGKRFFGQDPLLALNTIPAEVVNQVEVFDQKSERSQFTGFDDGNTTKTINVVTREDKRNGLFGKLKAGYGTDDRFQVEGSLTRRKGDSQLTLLGMSNNVNQKNFSNSDVMGIGQGGPRGPRFMQNQNNQVTGITQTESLGLNYSNLWNSGKIEGSYFYDRRQFENEIVSSRETFFDQGSQFYDEQNLTNSTNNNHRINLRLEQNLNDNNSIVFTPRLTFQDNQSDDYTSGITSIDTITINQTVNNYLSESMGYNFNGNLLFRHKFEKSGRSMFINMGSNLYSADKDSRYEDLQYDSMLIYDDLNKNTTWKGEITYIEPIGLNSQFQVNYAYSDGLRTSNRDAYSFTEATSDDPEYEIGLSNHFRSDLIKHTPSVSLMKRSWSQFFNATIAYENTSLQSDQQYPTEAQVSKSFNAVLPSLIGRFELANGANLFVRYVTSTNAPNGTQLQEVVDNSNPLFYSMGNSNLDQSYSHRLIARINMANIEKNTSFSSFVFATNTTNYITNATYLFAEDSTISSEVTLPAGSQLAVPVNLDGYWNVRNMNTWGFLVSELKTNINLSVGLTYQRQPGLSNEINNVSNTYNGNGKISFNSNISKNIDFDLSYASSYNRVLNSIQEGQNSRYATHYFKGKLHLQLAKGTVLRTDWNYQVYDGVSDSFDSQFMVWNATIGQKFLKNREAEVSLTVFDILNQNTGISQNIGPNYVQESRSLMLQQYFMFSVTYNLRHFNT